MKSTRVAIAVPEIKDTLQL